MHESNVCSEGYRVDILSVQYYTIASMAIYPFPLFVHVVPQKDLAGDGVVPLCRPRGNLVVLVYPISNYHEVARVAADDNTAPEQKDVVRDAK